MKVAYKELFANRNFRKDLAASLINRFGDSIDAIASSWIVYELTGEASWSAIIYAINRLPTIFLTPLAGPWVERHNKKMIMVVTDLIRALCVGVLATGLLLGFLSAPLIAVLSFIISSAEAFRIPAGTAIFPQIVPREQYGTAMSVNQASSSVVELIGTGVAAAIIALIGSAGAIYVDMVTFVLSALLIMSLELHEDVHKDSNGFSVSGYFADLKGGFVYCASKKRLVAITMMILFLNGILVPLNSLQTPMVTELFRGNVWYLSVFGTTLSISMLLGSVIYPMIQDRLNVKMVLVMICTGIAGFYLLMVAGKGLYSNLYFAMSTIVVLAAMLGLIISVGNMFLGIETIRMIDREYLARAASIGNALGSAIVPVTAFIVSIAVRFVGVPTIFVGAGLIAVAFCGVLFLNHSLDDEEPQAVDKNESLEAA
ncbi:MFS transporter, DHA3 family, macrolide efflux protein [Pseudobutyrivibrio sp. 49]|uniref:MFS transporter n=1 Tax=Pseudobutyrivibrio sp. 49 TaxID=1855344 RepID=UPI00087E8314|nr:MFS transporter [Pseudobutyrivibrio sp. 49]SDI59718.1 MFS transporter, DHA3 family, macrolide efflux protein [Pseudobutyrivibrio sp. 49]